MTLDAWCSSITFPLVRETNFMTALFFLSYVLINAILMANVVVAILLDKFISAVEDAKKEDEKEKSEEAEMDDAQNDPNQDGNPCCKESKEDSEGKIRLLLFEQQVQGFLQEIECSLDATEVWLEGVKDGRDKVP